MKKLTVVDPTPFYLQAGQSVALSPYVPRQQALKGSFLDTSHSYACKPTRDKRNIIKQGASLPDLNFQTFPMASGTVGFGLTVPDWKMFPYFPERMTTPRGIPMKYTKEYQDQFSDEWYAFQK